MNNIFISHFGKDDEHVQDLKARLISHGYDVRNFSVDSTNHKDGRKPSDQVVRRLLKIRINWSKTLICLIGEETHTRDWVDFEIDNAIKQGKRILGIYKHGVKETAEVPEKLKQLSANIVGWNSIDKLGDMIEGKNVPIENPDSSVASQTFIRPFIKCN